MKREDGWGEVGGGDFVVGWEGEEGGHFANLMKEIHRKFLNMKLKIVSQITLSTACVHSI